MQINIEKKAVMILLGIVLLLAGGIVYAYGTSSPSAFGHSLGELGIRESGYSIFVESAGTSYHNCVTTCNSEIKLANSTIIQTCYSYTNGQKQTAFSDCPSGKVDCGTDGLDRYCATRNTLDVTIIGKILVD